MKRLNFAKIKRKFIKGSKGVISLFLAILMVPFVSIAGMLVNAGRVNSAVAIFDEALCNASNSTLGTYDKFLRNRFALMAISQDTSDGGTKYGSTSPNYSADELINDVFKHYMEKNVGTLSNTYVTTEVNGNGLYPLSDSSVLLSSVLQSSKITVPAKLASDWGSFDDILSKFTESFNVFASIESFASSGFGLTSEIDGLLDAQDDLEEQIEKCNTARTEYESAYNAFSNAVDEFNSLIDKTSTASNKVNSCQEKVNQLSSKVSGLEKKIKDKQEQIEKLEEDTKNDNKEEIEALNKEIEDLEKNIKEEKKGYSSAVNDLSKAQTTLNGYKKEFNTKRSSVVDKKSTYYNKIVALRDEVHNTSNMAISFQDKAESVVNGAEGLISDGVSMGITIAKDNNKKTSGELKKENDEYKKQMENSEKDGNSSAATGYYNMMQENNSAINNISNNNVAIGNDNKLQQEAVQSLKDCNSELTSFAKRNLVQEYRTIYDALDALRLRIHNISVPDDFSKITLSKAYYTVNNPVNKSDVATIINNIEKEIANSSGWAVVKAVIGFLKAMFAISAGFDPELKANIDTSLYSANGGIPSKIKRVDHPIDSKFEKDDEDQSNAYKNLLNSFSTDDVYDTGGDTKSVFEQMQDLIEKLMNNLNNFSLRKLPKIADNVLDLFGLISGSQITNVLKDAAASMGKKMLLVGYISYNTANRTTYTEKALTGAKYNLPETSENSGYVFSGAEMEYIYNGSMSEKENQESLFQSLWIERVILDIAPIVMDATILQLATDLGAVTFGIGFVLVYAVYFFAESFVDTIILANGGEIPMVKSFVYLTPGGLPKLIDSIFSLKLNEVQSKKLYEGAGDCVSKLDPNTNVERYDDFKNKENAKGDKTFSKIMDLFSWDYTKSSQILLLLFRNTNTLLERLADIIQMEASYKSHSGDATYGFNLDKSYTYLRASGSFNTNMFIKIGTDDRLSSEKRVVYNGY